MRRLECSLQDVSAFVDGATSVENTKMNDCYFDKKDWRACKNEVRVCIPASGPTSVLSIALLPRRNADTARKMEAFRECWKRRGNDQRTSTKDS